MSVLALLVSAAGWAPVAAAVVATEVAILNNFLWNDRWTFRDRCAGTGWPQRLLRYNGITLGGLAISVGVLAALLHFFRMHYLVANLVAIGAGVLWNYSVNSWLTWVGDRGPQPHAALATAVDPAG